jgi:hypothetical protein
MAMHEGSECRLIPLADELVEEFSIRRPQGRMRPPEFADVPLRGIKWTTCHAYTSLSFFKSSGSRWAKK